MRIIGGQHRGRGLISPKDQRIRPTSDRVRESAFNIIQNSIGFNLHDSYALDLFCGAGTLAIEALSRGAVHTTLVDSNRTSLELATQNAEKIGVSHQCDFILRKAAQLPQNTKNKPANIIFIDPPYYKNLADGALINAIEKGYVENGALIYIEMSKKAIEPITAPDCVQIDDRTYGDTAIHFYMYKGV